MLQTIRMEQRWSSHYTTTLRINYIIMLLYDYMYSIYYVVFTNFTIFTIFAIFSIFTVFTILTILTTLTILLYYYVATLLYYYFARLSFYYVLMILHSVVTRHSSPKASRRHFAIDVHSGSAFTH